MLKILGVMLFSSVITLMSTASWSGYVCYTERIDKHYHDSMVVKYKGCQIKDHPCEDEELRHFGYYDGWKATQKALKRCMKSTPRFID